MTTAGILTGNTTNRYIVLFRCCLFLCLSVSTQGGSYNSVSNVFCRVGCANMIFLSGPNSLTISYRCFYRGDKFEWFVISKPSEKKKEVVKCPKTWLFLVWHDRTQMKPVVQHFHLVLLVRTLVCYHSYESDCNFTWHWVLHIPRQASL